MDKNELWRLYCQREKEFEKAKGRRTVITILAFAAAYFAVVHAVLKPNNLKYCAFALLISLLLSGFHFVLNATVFGYLANKGRAENEVLESIKKQMSEQE